MTPLFTGKMYATLNQQVQLPLASGYEAESHAKITRQMTCDDDRCEDDRDYDKESGKGYKSVRVCPQNSDASWDVEN